MLWRLTCGSFVLITVEQIKLLIELEKCQHTQHSPLSKNTDQALHLLERDPVSTKTNCGALAPDQCLFCHTRFYPNLLTISCWGEAVSQNEWLLLYDFIDTVLMAIRGSFLFFCWHKHCQSVSIISWNWLTCQSVGKWNKQYIGIILNSFSFRKPTNCHGTLLFNPIFFSRVGCHRSTGCAPHLTDRLWNLLRASGAARVKQVLNYRADILGSSADIGNLHMKAEMIFFKTVPQVRIPLPSHSFTATWDIRKESWVLRYFLPLTLFSHLLSYPSYSLVCSKVGWSEVK